jgi:hypothetical protein
VGGTRITDSGQDAWLLALDIDGKLAEGCGLISPTTAAVDDADLTAFPTQFVQTDIDPSIQQPLDLSSRMGPALSAAECELREPSEVSPPGSAVPLRFVSKVDIEWELTADVDTYQLFRGDATELSMGVYGDLIEGDIATNRTSDLETPASGEVWDYLVRGANELGIGSAGTTSDDTVRGFPPNPCVAMCPTP